VPLPSSLWRYKQGCQLLDTFPRQEETQCRASISTCGRARASLPVQGLEFDSLDTAEQEAARVAAETSRDQLPKVNAYEVTVEVKDEHGQRVLTVTMALMVYRVSPPPEPPDVEGRSPNPWGA
jgi:hypothetical protein